jgi:hypothetical protein
MRSKFWVLAACVVAAAVAVEPAPALAAPSGPAALEAATATTTVAAPAGATAAAVKVLSPRDGVDPAAVRPTAATAATPAPAKPAEPDPSQSPIPVSETVLLLAGLLAVGIIVRRRNY